MIIMAAPIVYGKSEFDGSDTPYIREREPVALGVNPR